MTDKIKPALICIGVLFVCTFLGVYLLGKNADKRKEEEVSTQTEGTGFVIAEAGSYDSADTAVVVKKDTDNSLITFKNMQVGKQYTLNYNGATTIYDKHGEALSMAQIQPGDLVDITFLKEKKRLNSLQLSTTGWELKDVSKYTINELSKMMTISEDVYKLTSDAVIISAGREAEIMDINAADVLKVSGVGNNIYSIVVEKGHGYLRLANEEYFVGGWIEVGQTVIREVDEDMLLVVPEGSYDVHISNKGHSGTKKVVINPNEEVTLDVGDLKGEDPKFGTVLFTVSPSSAEVYLDGTLTDISEAVTLEYGIHQMIVKAEGYDTITQYIKVGQEAAGIDVKMEKTEEDETETETETESEQESSSAPSVPETESESSTPNSGQDDNSDNENTDNTVSGNDPGGSGSVDNSNQTSTTGTYKVFLDAPVGAEAYVDGNYVGIVPCSFKKTSGNHVVTLRKTGYLTRSYTIQLDEDKKDINYSFNELEKSDEE